MTVDKYAADREHDGEENVVAQLTRLAKQLLEAEAAVKEADAELTKRQGVVNTLKFKTMPALYEKMGGVEELILNINGERYPLTLERKIAAKLSEAKKDAVFEHIRAQGQAHMINSNIVIPFTKGQDADKQRFLQFLETFEGHLDVGQKEEIHSSTYTSWCQDNLMDNPGVDLKDFGAYEVRQVKLGKPKTSKSKREK